MDDLKEILAAATPGPWSYRLTEYDDWGTVRAGKWFICQAKDPRFHDADFLNDCRARNIDPWSANARLIAMAPDLAAEVLRLRDALKRIATPEAFYVATSDINPEAYARMIYADYVLDGYALHAASDKAEYEVRQRYPLRGEPRATLKGSTQ